MNAYQRLLSLFSPQPKLIGVVSALQSTRYVVTLVGGGGVINCTSATPYSVGAKVFVKGTEIVGVAPNSTTVVTIEV